MTRVRRHCATKRFLSVIASEPQGERGNPQRKGNAKFMDCHEFARSCFTNSRNDKALVIFIKCHTYEMLHLTKLSY